MASQCPSVTTKFSAHPAPADLETLPLRGGSLALPGRPAPCPAPVHASAASRLGSRVPVSMKPSRVPWARLGPLAFPSVHLAQILIRFAILGKTSASSLQPRGPLVVTPLCPQAWPQCLAPRRCSVNMNNGQMHLEDFPEGDSGLSQDCLLGCK